MSDAISSTAAQGPAARRRLRGVRPELAVLAGILVISLALRLALWLGWHPGFLGFSDSSGYIVSSNEGEDLFAGTLRTPGYPIALRALRFVWDDLAFVTAVQHLLGLASAALLYAATVRLGAPRGWALVPAALLALTGSLIFLANAVLAETVFTFLLCLTLWLVARVLDAQRTRVVVAMTALAGALLGWAALTRTAALPLVGLVPLWLAWAVRGGARGRAAAAVPMLVTGVAVVGGMLLHAHAVTDQWSFARNDAVQAYGRVAPFADCREFDPPEDMRVLCPQGDARERQGHDYWTYDVNSPLQRYLAGEFGPVDEPWDDINAFTRAAVLGQPKAYATAVLRDLVRVVDPDFPSNPNPAVGNLGQGCTPGCMLTTMRNPIGEEKVLAAVHEPASSLRKGSIGLVETWERSTRPVGWVVALILALGAAAPLLARGRARRGAVLLLACPLVVIGVSTMTVSYDWRYVVVTVPFLAAAAALGAAALTARRRERA